MSGTVFALWRQCIGSRRCDAAPLIGPEAGVCTGQSILQLGAKLVQLDGEPGEAVVQLIVCGHGA